MHLHHLHHWQQCYSKQYRSSLAHLQALRACFCNRRKKLRKNTFKKSPHQPTPPSPRLSTFKDPPLNHKMWIKNTCFLNSSLRGKHPNMVGAQVYWTPSMVGGEFILLVRADRASSAGGVSAPRGFPWRPACPQRVGGEG